MRRRATWMLAGALGLAGCQEYPVTQYRLQIDAFPPESSLLGGVVDAKDFVFSESGGTGSESIEPLFWSAGDVGRHYTVWVEGADGEPVPMNRFVIVDPPDRVREYNAVTGDPSPQVRDYETTEFRGWVNTICFNGPCGGVDLTASELVDGPAVVTITREEDGSAETTPSDDVYVRGPVQPYARGTIRGTLGDPFGNPVPVVEITMLPQVDNTHF